MASFRNRENGDHRGGALRWTSELKDEELPHEVASVENAYALGALDSGRVLREAIDRRYMLPN